MSDGEEFSSWLESRRLIISQLSAMDASIRELAACRTRDFRSNLATPVAVIELSVAP